MENRFLHLNSRDELLRIDISKIVYFEADGNYTNIVLVNKLKGVVCLNLAKLQVILVDKLKDKASTFVRIGKKYIINRTFVYQINIVRHRLILSDGQNFAFQLEISKEALKKLKDLYTGNNDKE
ncbi:MAG: LytTR family transcriptional regulator [Bacteroidales bacterium]|nr:LytTR family transcriptional regulator [Bacteroidales bacterium]